MEQGLGHQLASASPEVQPGARQDQRQQAATGKDARARDGTGGAQGRPPVGPETVGVTFLGACTRGPCVSVGENHGRIVYEIPTGRKRRDQP
ncbi:hypothetical protein [Nitrospirillum viridazoti]|uniref:Uncharacterized protein n=2 Tax=Nitrospirillum TaxID=1543705 RepID=A0A248JTW3_9PROT|nr:hypothetical protein [Nitrospirillum amazonense]ASG22172.1 hypothetical protein Y958_14455 [Nitrospirillum amazonense CBAmc]TWB32684.1 hypothetical protein FBZ91_11612 [Nitrospirillum amazonense]TWB64329.1 hypothetical protein FBZ92_101223 [Nitrospirillum amazonense]